MTRDREEAIAYAREVVGRDPMARHLGIEVLAVEEDFARVGLQVRGEHLNALGRAHGIILYALADQALAVAANSGGDSAMVLEAKISFLNGVEEGTRLEAEARPVERKRKIGFWDVKVVRAEDGLVVAACQGLTYHKA